MMTPMGIKAPLEHAAEAVRYAGASEAGRVRAVNQDSYFVGRLPSGGILAVVADGMGGHQTGEVASQKAVDIIQRELSRSRAHPPTAIARAVQAANLEIFEYASDYPEHQGMGTTLTTVYLDDQVGLVGHIGDSRAYLIRNGRVTQLTQDHSWVAERVRQGVLSESEAKRHRWRNVITNALGTTPEIKLDIAGFEVQAGDRLLLCSDGVSMLFSEEAMAAIVCSHDPEGAVRALIEGANMRGSPDNITAVVLEVVSVEARPKRYELPPRASEIASVKIGDTMSGIRAVEETFPKRDLFAKLRRQSWYPYRFWLLGCLYLFLLFLIFSIHW
jgi:protein phosphatase